MDFSPLGSSVHGTLSRQEHWSMLPFPSPGELSNPGIESTSLMYPALPGRFFSASERYLGSQMVAQMEATISYYS